MAGRISASAVDHKDLESPYDQIVKLKQQKKDDIAITMAVGMHPVVTCASAAETIGPKANVTDYIKILEQVSLRVEIANKLSLEVKKLLKGEEVPYSKLGGIIGQLDSGLREWTTLDKVEPETDMWVPTGWEVWDEFIGGVPRYGLTIIGAPPGTGKTSLVLKIIGCITKERKVSQGHDSRGRKKAPKKIPGRPVGLMSLELPNGVLLSRFIQIVPDLTDEQRKLVRITDESYDIYEATSAVSRLVMTYPEVDDIFIDFADLLVPTNSEESVEIAGTIYKDLANLAKQLKKRVYLISQLSRSYVGGIPQVSNIRWSGLAEAMASLIVLLYNPDQLFVNQGKNSKENRLPYIPDKAYIIEGKSRFGYKYDGHMGAIQLDWLGERGWGDEGGVWFSL